MGTNRFAILIGSTGSDPDLNAIENDISGLEQILQDSKISSMQTIDKIINQTKNFAEDKLEIFFRDKYLDDTMLIYSSCHGIVMDDSIYMTMRT